MATDDRDDLGWWLKTLVLFATSGQVTMAPPRCSGSGCEALARSLLDAYVRMMKPARRHALRPEDV